MTQTKNSSEPVESGDIVVIDFINPTLKPTAGFSPQNTQITSKTFQNPLTLGNQTKSQKTPKSQAKPSKMRVAIASNIRVAQNSKIEVEEFQNKSGETAKLKW